MLVRKFQIYFINVRMFFRTCGSRDIRRAKKYRRTVLDANSRTSRKSPGTTRRIAEDMQIVLSLPRSPLGHWWWSYLPYRSRPRVVLRNLSRSAQVSRYESDPGSTALASSPPLCDVSRRHYLGRTLRYLSLSLSFSRI